MAKVKNKLGEAVHKVMDRMTTTLRHAVEHYEREAGA